MLGCSSLGESSFLLFCDNLSFIYGSAQEKTIKAMKEALTKAHFQQFFQFNLLFYIKMDASGVEPGAAQTQD